MMAVNRPAEHNGNQGNERECGSQADARFHAPQDSHRFLFGESAPLFALLFGYGPK
jgi:hypothetical protein